MPNFKVIGIDRSRTGVPRELSLAEIFQLGYYWETKILLTAVSLDLFTILDDRN